MSNPIVNVTITGQGAVVQGASFTTPAFITPTGHFQDRVRTFTSLTEVQNLMGDDSEAAKAVAQFFAPTPSVKSVKVIKQDSTINILVTGLNPTIQLFANNTGEDLTFSDEIIVSGTGADPSLAAVDLYSNIVSHPVLSTIFDLSQSGDTITLTKSVNPGNHIIKPDPANTPDNDTGANPTKDVDISFTATQSPGQALSAGIGEDGQSFYHITTSSRDGAELAYLSLVTAAQKKLLFLGLTASEMNDYVSALTFAPSTQERVVVMAQETSRNYAECSMVGYNGLYAPGSVTYNNLQLPNVERSLWVYSEASIVTVTDIGNILITQNGKTLSGENIETVRGEDALTNDLELAFTNLLINQQGTKLGYTNGSINKMYTINQSVLDKYVRVGFIKDGYEISYLPESKVPVADKAAGVYQGGSFEAEYVGAINKVSIRGRLSLDITQS